MDEDLQVPMKHGPLELAEAPSSSVLKFVCWL
jgi:hypothetical protein